MIVACSRGDGAATNNEIAQVTVALQHLSVGEPFLGPDRSCAPVVADPTVRRVQPGYVAAPASLLALAAWQAGHGAMQARPTGTGKRQR